MANVASRVKTVLTGLADPIAAYVPDECFYARFAGPHTLQWLLQAAEELGLGPEVARLQTQLCLPELRGGPALADKLIAGLAIIGTAQFGQDVASSSGRRMVPAAACSET